MTYSDRVTAFDAVVQALRVGDWHRAASLCDESSLMLLQRELLAGHGPPERGLTVADLQAHDPELPLEVAEYQVARHNRIADPAHRFARDLPGIADVAALRALAPAAGCAAWLDGQSLERQTEWLRSIGELSAAQVAVLTAAGSERFNLAALGWVPDGDTLAHVVYGHAGAAAEDGGDDSTDADPVPGAWPLSDGERALVRERRHGRPSIATCRRQPDGGWRLVASQHEFPGVSGHAVAICDDGSADADTADAGESVAPAPAAGG